MYKRQMLSGACATPEFLMYMNYFIGQEGASLVQAFFRFFKVDDMDTGLVLELSLIHI